jgi:hypothetical protein
MKKLKSLNLKNKKQTIRLFVISLVLLLFSSTSILSVEAQTQGNNWTQPENLSNTGATTNPRLITSASGRLHAFWEDQYSQVAYKYLENDVWSNNFNLSLPFYQTDYKLVTDQTGWILAFWIDPGSNNLYYSGVQELNVPIVSRWFSPIRVSSGVTAFDISIDSSNQINLVFLRALDTEDLPSGIYYQKTQGNFQRWGTSNILYQSKYFRNQLPPVDSTAAQTVIESNWSHVDIETGEADQFYVSWENPALKRLYYSYSSTNGNSWTEPEIISSPSPDNTYLTPQNLLTANLPNHTMQIWQLSEPGGNCSLQYRVSLENQNDWSPQQSLANLVNECPENISWFPSGEADTLFVFSGANKFTIIAWNGERWSLAQSQSELNQFTNPNTFRSLEFTQYATIINFPEIHNIAIDEISEDVWYSHKTFGNLEAWYNTLSEWSTISNAVITENNITNLKSFNGLDGYPAFIWSVEDFKDDGSVFSKLQIAKIQPDGFVPGYISVRNNLSGKINSLSLNTNLAKERLALIWQGGIYGQLINTWADLNELNNPVGWSEINTDTTFPAIQSPMLVNTNGSDMYAVFSTQYQENRGIYTSLSMDAGETWMEPKLLYSGVNIGDCPLIKNPELAIQNDIYTLLYTCYTDTGGVGPLSLNFVSSNDAGQSWSTPQMIAEGEILWSKLIQSQDGTLHQLWMVYNGETALFHNYSLDNGQTWLSRTNFSLIEGKYPVIHVSADHTGQLHVLHAVPLENNNTVVQYHIWNGSSWINGESLELFTYQAQDNLLLTSTIDKNQNLTIGIIISSSSIETDTNQLITARYALGIEPPEEPLVAPLPAPVENNTSEINQDSSSPTSETTPLLEPTPVPVLNNQQSENTNAWLGIVIGSVAAFGLMVLIFLFIKRKN